MLKSMTAFGRSHLYTPLGRFVAEIRTLNRKFLDISVTTQKGLTGFESDIRRAISSQIHRGKVDVAIWATFEGTPPVKVTPNIAYAKEIQKAWNLLAEELNMDETCDLEILQQENGILIYEEDLTEPEEYRKILNEVVAGALKEAMAMKIGEGEALQKDIEARLNLLKGYIQRIEENSGNSVQKYREKLNQKMLELVPDLKDDRILKEIALFAEKVDISEEITRFTSHIKQFQKYMSEDNEGVGKTLEFLVQELLREANTIGSKSQDVAISQVNIEIKTEIERIREQIQNVE